MKNPVEEFVGMAKRAGAFGAAMKKFPSHMAHAGAGAVAAGAVGLAGAGLGAAVSGIIDAATKGRDFRSMMGANEDLQMHHEQDPKRFNLMFSTLRNVNPEFSKDPLIAGSFMRRMIESPMGIGGIAGEALKHRGDYPETAFGVAHDYARGGAQAGIAESMKSRSPEEMLELHKPTLDYQHGQAAQMKGYEASLRGGMEQAKQERGFSHDRSQAADVKAFQEALQGMKSTQMSEQQARQHAHDSRQSKAQRNFQAALQRIPEHSLGSRINAAGDEEFSESTKWRR